MGLAQAVEIHFAHRGLEAALDMAVERAGRWFDPELVTALLATRGDTSVLDLASAVTRWRS